MSMDRLSSAQTHSALDATVAVTCALSLLAIGFLSRRRTAASAVAGAVEPNRGAWIPWAAFLGVCALLLGNQLVVNAYIVRTHGGDPAFITRFLGRGWFALAPDAPPVRWLVASLPGSWLDAPLSYSVLRVQAVLELPFALLAYLAVVAMLDGGLYRRLVRSVLLPLAALSFTFTFCLIELRLHNPWTQSDLYARWLAALGVIVWWAARRLRTTEEPVELRAPPLGILGLLAFFAGAAAVGAVVLVLYDAALLYNLGHLRTHLPVLGASVLVGTLAAVFRSVAESRRAGRSEPSPGLQALTSVLGAFAAVFFAPSLSIRYCGARASALLGAGLLLLAALLLGIGLAARAMKERGLPRWRTLLGLAVAMATTYLLLLGDVAGRLFGASQPRFELVLLQRTALVLPAAALAVWLLDWLLGSIGTPRRIGG